MTEECSKCIKAFGKLFRPIVVSNVNALPQQASVFMRIFYLLMGLVETRDNTAKKKKLLSDTFLTENWLR